MKRTILLVIIMTCSIKANRTRKSDWISDFVTGRLPRLSIKYVRNGFCTSVYFKITLWIMNKLDV